MKNDPLLPLELVLVHYQGRLKDHLSHEEKHIYESLYFDNYLELRRLNKDKAKPFMDWWVRYERL